MLLWPLTMLLSAKPLTNMFIRILLSFTFVSVVKSCRCSHASPPPPPIFQNTTPSPIASSTTSATPRASEVATEPSHIFGKFQYTSEKDFEAYLKELGVGTVLRTMAKWATPIVTVQRACPGGAAVQQSYIETASTTPCNWTIRTDTLFKSHTLRFKLNTPGTDTTMDGRKVSYTIHRPDNNVLIEVQTGSNGKETTLTRTFSADKMDVAMEVNGVEASSVFNRAKVERDELGEWRK